jgi:capsule polysaccharide export protein KpsE/RkpR
VNGVQGGVINELDRLQTTNQPENGSENSTHVPESPIISAVSILDLIWVERRFVLRSGFASLLVFTILAFLLPKYYTATTQLMPPNYSTNSQMALALPALGEKVAAGVGDGGVMGLASQLLGMNTSGELVIGVIQSRTVEDRLIDKLGLMKVYSDRYLEDARKHLENNTRISIGARTGIISIQVTDRQPTRAAAIARAYVNELNQVLTEVSASSAHRERVFLEERLQEIKQQSDTDAKEFALFASQNAAVDIPDQAKAMVSAGAQLQSEFIVAQAGLKGLQQIFTPENARVRAAQARVDELQRQVEKFGGKNVDPVKDASLARSELYPSVRQLPLLGVKYLDLFRRTKIDEAVFELLTKEYEIAKIQEVREAHTAEVLDVANVPEKKSSPHRLLIILAGACLGSLFASVWIIARKIWREVDSRDPGKVLAQDVFRTIKVRTWDTRFCQKRYAGVQRLVRWVHRPEAEERTQPES